MATAKCLFSGARSSSITNELHLQGRLPDNQPRIARSSTKSGTSSARLPEFSLHTWSHPMHRADIVLIGPLDPLLPRTIRVRLTVVVAISVMMFFVGLLAVAVLTVQQSWSPSSTFPWLAGVLPVSESRQDPRGDDVTMRVGSRPAGAAILRGNRELGHTPAIVTAAQQDLMVRRRDGFLDAFVRARGPSVEVPLWHVQPDMRVLRPPFPGAAIKSAAFLPDGRVSLAVEVPPNSERQAWAYDPAAARMDRLGRTDVPGTIPS